LPLQDNNSWTNRDRAAFAGKTTTESGAKPGKSANADDNGFRGFIGLGHDELPLGHRRIQKIQLAMR